jgi:SAM-dependent methyltransferase
LNRANYGLYSSPQFLATLLVVALVSLLALFLDFFRTLFVFLLATSVGLLVTIPVIFGRARMQMVPKIAEAARAGGLILDIGTGRGFPAIEIAKRVPESRVIAIDVWEQPAPGQMHKGWIIGNTRDQAVRNAVVEGVGDRVEFKQCDVRKLPFASETFDVVVAFLALHQPVYFGKEGERALDEIGRVLKRGGRFVDVDMLVGKKVLLKLKDLGFSEVEVKKVHLFPLTLRMLVATK